MTSWQQYWFPQGNDAPPPTRDAALWSPQAFAEGQREMWQQAAQAAEQWWGFWRSAWPGLPLQLPVGVVLPPAAEEAAEPAAEARAAPARRKAAPPAKTRRATGARGK